MASTQANTWPPLIGPGSLDHEKQAQLYGSEVFASAKILDSSNDEFFHPVNRSLTGYSFEGILYQNGAAVPNAPRASWYLEAPGPFRGQEAAFPRMGMILATDAGLSILNTETGQYTLWMIALRRDDAAFTHNFTQALHGTTPDHVSYRNGRVTVSLYPDAGATDQLIAFLIFDFVQDQIYLEWAAYRLPDLTAYTNSPAHYTVNTPITPNVCQLANDSGSINAWAVAPALPAGLGLDASTGVISGTPTAVVSPDVYTITAKNRAGSATCMLILDVKDPLVTRTPVKFSMGETTSWVVMDNGELWGCGAGVSCTGLGLPNGDVPLLKKTNLTNVADVKSGYNHWLALKKDGTVWAWGNNYYGQLGNGAGPGDPFHATPIQVPITGVVAIDCTAFGSIALKADGTVWTWGAISSVGTPASPVVNANGNCSSPSNWNGLTGATAIAAGWDHWLVLKSDGSVWGYGSDAFRQLGPNATFSTMFSSVMVQVLPAGGAKAIAAGYYTSFFVTPAGAVLGCGRDDNRQIGLGGWTVTSPCPCVVTPQLIDSTVMSNLTSGVTQVVAGLHWAMALKADGTTYSWGSPATGAIALGVPATYSNPDPVTGVVTNCQNPTRTHYPLASGLTGCNGNSGVMVQGGGAMTCGKYSNGMLGNGSYADAIDPVTLMLP